MGSHDISQGGCARAHATYMKAVLEDLEALELLLERGAFDTGRPRIGAEQEYVLVDARMQPAPVAEALLARAQEPRFTAELGRYNLEANLTPLLLEGDCLARMRAELEELDTAAAWAARAVGAQPLKVGIPPGFEPVHAALEQMTPCTRFDELNRKTVEAFGGRVPLQLQGRDRLRLWHDNMMLEAAGTSFQVHLQVAPDAFARSFNCALLSAAPLVAACAFSPMMAGRRLWHETRIPLMDSCADLRAPGRMRRGTRSRTSLGTGWVRRTVLELFQRDLARFDVVLESPVRESALQEMQAGRMPQLGALATFAGSIWPWMRACYGTGGERPHLRIENRLLSAGPTVVDELANAAFWWGLMVALPLEVGDPRTLLSFDDAEANVRVAARDGLGAELRWLGGERVRARELVLRRLLPLARAGLRAAGLDAGDVDGLLDVLEERVRTGRTGAAWMLEAFDALPSRLSRRERAWRLTAATARHAASGAPVHTWPVSERRPALTGVEAVPVAVAVRSDLPSLPPDELALLAERVMAWEEASVLAVEDASGDFLGLVHAEDVARWREGGRQGERVEELGIRPAEAVRPEASALEVLQSMRRRGEACRVVLSGSHLDGVVLARDLEEALAQAEAGRSRRPAHGGADADAHHGR